MTRARAAASIPLIEAAVALADTLARENAALRALDVPRATAMLDAKRAALADFTRARALLYPIGPEQQALARQVADRLDAAAAENKRLLERAIAVQGDVISTLARAAEPATSQAYGRSGTRSAAGGPVALRARA